MICQIQQAFREVFLFGFSFWVWWGLIYCCLWAASPPPLPRLPPGSTSKARYWSQHQFSQLLCDVGAHVPRSSWSSSVPDIWVYPCRPGLRKEIPSAKCVLKEQTGLSSLPSHKILQGYIKKELESTCEEVPHKHLSSLWAVAWPDRICVLNPLKNSLFCGKICTTRLFLSSDGWCGKWLKCNFCNSYK